MLLSALFPTRDIGTDPAKIRDWAQAAEGLGYRLHRGRRSRLRRGAARRLEADLQRARSLPRDLHDDGLHRRRHQDHQAVQRRAHPAAAPDRPRRQAGGRGRHPERRPAAPGRRRRLEPRRVRGARHRVEDARRAAGRADRGDAPPVDRGPRHASRASSTSWSTSTSLPRAGAAADPDLVRRLVRRRGQARRAGIGDGWMPILSPDAAAEREARRCCASI